MYGIDVSAYQKGLDLSLLDIDFVIIKATEGIGSVSSTFFDFVEQAKQNNLLIGCYHFARPDLHGNVASMEKEADFFLNTVTKAGLLDKAILVLDWETEPIDRPDLIQAWLDIISHKSKATPIIYGSKSKLSSKTFQPFWNRYPFWVAQWPTSKAVIGCQPYIGSLPDVPFDYDIWQFSANGRTSYDSKMSIDCDYSFLSKEQWMRLAGTEPEVYESLSIEMQWAIDNRIIAGYGDSKYGPKDPCTREQVAAMLYRYHQQFK